MSLTETVLLDCACGAPVMALVCSSVNAERHPHLRDAVLERSFHQFTCGACNRGLVAEKRISYLDLARHQFYSVALEIDRGHERALQTDLVEAWNIAFGEGAPISVTTIFQTEKFHVRLCFGLEELREKLVVCEAGLDDLALEIVKVEILAQHTEWAAMGVRTLRLDHVEADGRLAFVLERASDPPTILEIGVLVPRTRHDELAAMPWRDLVERYPGIAWGGHVSLLRLAS